VTAVRSRSTRRTTSAPPSKTTTRQHRSASAAPRTQSRVVVRPLPQKAAGPQLRIFPRRVVSLRLVMVMGVLLFFGLLFGAVAIQGQRISGQRQIDLLSAQISTQQDLNHSLRAQVAEREAPERITAEAEKLNMIEPGPVVPLAPGAPSSATADLAPSPASSVAGNVAGNASR